MAEMTQRTLLPLESIQGAFELLKTDVRRACLTQVGDTRQLQEQIQACLRFDTAVTQVCYVLCSDTLGYSGG